MLNNNITYKLHNANIQADMTGQPIYVGDIVLLKGYGSMDKNTFAVVKKVNKKSIVVEITYQQYNYGDYVKEPSNYQGHWNCYPNAATVTKHKLIKRPGLETLKLSPAFIKEIKANAAATINAYPEALI